MTSFETGDRFFRPLDVKASRRNQRGVQARRILTVFANIVFVAILTLAAFWIYRSTVSDSRFAIARVDVVGSKHSSPGEMRALTSRYVGRNLFKLDLDAIQKEVSSAPWVDHVAIEKVLPSTLRLRIVERHPVAILAAADGLRYVDANGIAFASLLPRDGDPELVVIDGGDPADLRRTVEFLERLRVTAPALYARVSQITPVIPSGYQIFDRELATSILVDDEGSVAKWTNLYQLAATENFRSGDLDYADLRFAGRVIVKPHQKRNDLAVQPLNGGAAPMMITN